MPIAAAILRTSLFFILLTVSTLIGSEVCYFLPPAGWECAQPKNLSPYVQVGFVGKGSTDFNPSINLAFEDEVDISLKEYVKAVKELHVSQPETTWRDLGKFPMKAGEGRLVEITSKTSWGEIKVLQALFVKDNRAYILTAALRKEDLPAYQKELLKSFQSLSLVPDLLTPLTTPSEKNKLQSLLAGLGDFLPDEDKALQQKKQWEALQQAVLQEHPDLGGHWHFLVLKEGYAKIYPQ